MTTLDQKDRDALSKKEFAFPDQRKEPLEDASHVRNAIARFNQVKDVSDADLKKTYRKLARQFHPDSNPGDAKAEARFKEISEAHAVLSDRPSSSPTSGTSAAKACPRWLRASFSPGDSCAEVTSSPSGTKTGS